MEITTDRNSRILSYKKLFFNIACSYALSPETACTSRGNQLLLSPQLKHITQHLTVLTSTVWSPETFSQHWWMSVDAIFSTWRNSVTHLSFIHTSMSDTIVSDCSSAAICHIATKLNGILVGKFILVGKSSTEFQWIDYDVFCLISNSKIKIC